MTSFSVMKIVFAVTILSLSHAMPIVFKTDNKKPAFSVIDMVKIPVPPHCARTERAKRWAKLGHELWQKNPVTINFKNYLESEKIPRNLQEELVIECATLWAEKSNLTFAFAPLRNKTGNIEISFVYMDGPYNRVGVGLSPVPSWKKPTSYLKLDSDDAWKARIADEKHGVSLKWAICHEMGHNLGLSHSGDAKAVMYPWGIHDRPDDNLGEDDINGIRALYGPSNGQTWIGPKNSEDAKKVVLYLNTNKMLIKTTRNNKPSFEIHKL